MEQAGGEEGRMEEGEGKKKEGKGTSGNEREMLVRA